MAIKQRIYEGTFNDNRLSFVCFFIIFYLKLFAIFYLELFAIFQKQSLPIDHRTSAWVILSIVNQTHKYTCQICCPFMRKKEKKFFSCYAFFYLQKNATCRWYWMFMIFHVFDKTKHNQRNKNRYWFMAFRSILHLVQDSYSIDHQHQMNIIILWFKKNISQLLHY